MTHIWNYVLNSSLILPGLVQSLTTPNGLIVHMFVPIEGRRHDGFISSASGLPIKLRSINRPTGEPYVLYGDPANELSRNIVTFPWSRPKLKRERESVQQGYEHAVFMSVWNGHLANLCNILHLWIFEHKPDPFAAHWQYYLVGAILTNCHT